jgi:hypothetical protein
MENLRKRLKCGAVLFGLAALLPHVGSAQAIHVNRRQVSAHPDVPVNSLTVSVSPSFVNFALVAKGTATGSSAVNVTTTWAATLCIWTCEVNLYAYFANASQALSGGSPVAYIPSSEVLGEMPTGTPTTYTAFTQSNPLGGASASLLLFSQSVSIYTGNNSRTDALSLEINLGSQPQLPAGTYSGTLYIQAQTL